MLSYFSTERRCENERIEARKQIDEARNKLLVDFLQRPLDDGSDVTSGAALKDENEKPTIKDESVTGIDAKLYRFPFKNLVLAGGGAKGAAYCGVARALEQHGILNDIQRFAGASAGAIAAALFAVGFNSFDLEHIMRVNLEGLLKDGPPGNIGRLLHLYYYLGCHPADKFKNFLGYVFKNKTGNPDINFYEVYHKYGKELCIIVTNANTMSEEYCHVKTTPYMPIRDAVRMSMSIPVEFQPVSYKIFDDTCLHVDGGVICNYPVHCFDGWYLSMNRIQPDEMYKDPFTSTNTNLESLGCLVYSDNEYVAFRDQIENNCNVPTGDLPKTKLASTWEEKKKQKNLPIFYTEILRAQEDFLQIFQGKSEISMQDFEQILTKDCIIDDKKECELAKQCAEMLFGKDVNVKTIFRAIQKKDQNKVTIDELSKFVEEIRCSVLHKFKDLQLKRKEIDGMKSFMSTLIFGLNTAVMKIFFKERDVARTVGINTWYIETLDFAMEADDRKFLLDHGKRSTEEFLKHFVQDNKLPLDPDITFRAVPNSTSLTEKELEEIKHYTT